MPIVPLRPYAEPFSYRAKPQRLLALWCSVKVRGRACSVPVPFVVDTGSQRTVIVPHWKKRIESNVGERFTIVGDGREATGLLATFYFKLAHDAMIEAQCVTGERVTLNRSTSDGLRATVSLAHVPKDQVARGLKINTKFNLLGMDVLSEWGLYHNPQTRLSFLAHRCHYIDEHLRAIAALKPLFEPPGDAGPARVIPS